VGIIGRTGTGKSTLVAALFRIIELESGYIHIDGFNIGKLPLETLRLRLSVIPQNPFLMTGSVRYNLDPFSQFQDWELFDSLRAVQLERKLIDSGEGLQFQVTNYNYNYVTKYRFFTFALKISEGGLNLSQGERQLIALAAAILKKSKILILDEATAHIDTRLVYGVTAP